MGFRIQRRHPMNFRNHNHNLVAGKDVDSKIFALLEKKISDSERSILDSFKRYSTKNGSLTTKQYDLLLSIENRYSDENVKKTSDWISSFDQAKKDRLSLAVDYYSGTSYFHDLVMTIKNDRNYIPTEKQYNSMCHNKYFDNALKNYNAEPIYDIGDLVVFRDNNRNYHRDKTAICMVADISEKRSFEKNGRIYSLMILGTEDSINVPESSIKIYREKKVKSV